MEYEITRETLESTRQELTRDQLLALITDAGREPVERDAFYRPITERFTVEAGV